MKKQSKILFLLEEQSAEEMLKKFIPRCFPSLSCTYRRFSGKPNLLTRLEKTIRNHPEMAMRIFSFYAIRMKTIVWN